MGRRLRGRDHCLCFGELVRTGIAAALAGTADLCSLRPARFNPRTKLLGILHHEKDLPILEFTELQRPVGVLLHGTEVVLVMAGKSTKLRPQPLPLFPALLETVRLSISRFPFEVALINAKPHYMLVISDVGILDYTDPGLRKRDVFCHGLDSPSSRLLHILLGPRTRGKGRAFPLALAFAPAPALALCHCPCLSWSLPD